MNNVSGIHHKNLQDTAGNNYKHKALEHIGLALTVFFGEKKEREKNSLNDSQEYEDGK